MSELKNNLNKEKANTNQNSKTENDLNIQTDGLNENHPTDKLEFCKKWLEDSNYDDEDADQSSIAESSTTNVSSVIETDSELSDIISSTNDIKIKNNSFGSKAPQEQHVNVIQNFFKGDNSLQTFGDIRIQNSNRVHIGNITYVTGPIHIVNTGGGNIGTLNQTMSADEKFDGNSKSENKSDDFKANKKNKEEEKEEREESNDDSIYIGPIVRQMDKNVLRIIPRIAWLAQPAIAFEELSTPVPFVLISHTATEMTTTQAETIFVVRNIQTYHIESRNWSDIAYNFLIGCDSNIYEGRGWKRIGAHTYGYNKRGIGITFVGCFLTELPPPASLAACKLLIKKGIDEGFIAPDYKLLGNCQCSATESPGKRLFEEIKTWPNWTDLEQEDVEHLK